jgi:hypothetical protein
MSLTLFKDTERRFEEKEEKKMSEIAVLGNDRGVLFTNADEKLLYPQGVDVDETRAIEIEDILKNQKVLVRYVRKSRKKIPFVYHNEGVPEVRHTLDKGTPVGALVAFLTKEGHIRFGWSRRHSKKEPIPFTKAVARRVAMCRAMDEVVFQTRNGLLVQADTRPLPRCVAKQVPSFLERAMKYFKKNGVLNFSTTDAKAKAMEAGQHGTA